MLKCFLRYYRNACIKGFPFVYYILIICHALILYILDSVIQENNHILDSIKTNRDSTVDIPPILQCCSQLGL